MRQSIQIPKRPAASQMLMRRPLARCWMTCSLIVRSFAATLLVLAASHVSAALSSADAELTYSILSIENLDTPGALDDLLITGEVFSLVADSANVGSGAGSASATPDVFELLALGDELSAAVSTAAASGAAPGNSDAVASLAGLLVLENLSFDDTFVIEIAIDMAVDVMASTINPMFEIASATAFGFDGLSGMQLLVGADGELGPLDDVDAFADAVTLTLAPFDLLEFDFSLDAFALADTEMVPVAVPTVTPMWLWLVALIALGSLRRSRVRGRN